MHGQDRPERQGAGRHVPAKDPVAGPDRFDGLGTFEGANRRPRREAGARENRGGHLRRGARDRHNLMRRPVSIADPLVEPGIPGTFVLLAEVLWGVHCHAQDVRGPAIEHPGLRVQFLELAHVLGQPFLRVGAFQLRGGDYIVRAEIGVAKDGLRVDQVHMPGVERPDVVGVLFQVPPPRHDHRQAALVVADVPAEDGAQAERGRGVVGPDDVEAGRVDHQGAVSPGPARRPPLVGHRGADQVDDPLGEIARVAPLERLRRGLSHRGLVAENGQGRQPPRRRRRIDLAQQAHDHLLPGRGGLAEDPDDRRDRAGRRASPGWPRPRRGGDHCADRPPTGARAAAIDCRRAPGPGPHAPGRRSVRGSSSGHDVGRSRGGATSPVRAG